jgi:hypothetical protein
MENENQIVTMSKEDILVQSLAGFKACKELKNADQNFADLDLETRKEFYVNLKAGLKAIADMYEEVLPLLYDAIPAIDFDGEYTVGNYTVKLSLAESYEGKLVNNENVFNDYNLPDGVISKTTQYRLNKKALYDAKANGDPEVLRAERDGKILQCDKNITKDFKIK